MERYSVFLIERYYNGFSSDFKESCFQYVATFDTLEEAKIAQKEYELKTIILSSY